MSIKSPGLALVCLCMAAVAFVSGGEECYSADGPPAGRDTVYVIPIHGAIDRAMLAFVSRGVGNAKDANAKFVIFDIDTFGGRVDSALQITTLIGSVEPAKSVAYVTAQAASTGVSWSAGAIIAFSCSCIYMAPGTSMGAAAPVYLGPQGMIMAPEKEVSAVRAQAEALAEKNGYPRGIARAMVDEKVVLHEIYVDGKPMLITEREARDIEREAFEKGQEVEFGEIIDTEEQLLTLTAGDMEKYGVSSGTVGTFDDLYKALGCENPAVVALEKTTADEIVGTLTSPTIISLLVIIALITLYMEITSPGFGVPGTIAIVCFAVIFTSNSLLGRVGSLELLMFVVGVVLLIVEVLIIPGFGVAGIGGIVLIVLSLVLSMQGFVLPEFSWQWDMLIGNLMAVGFSVLVSVIVMAVLAHFVPRVPVLSRLALSASQQAAQGFTVQTKEAAGELLGKRGVAVTKLRPSGKARIGQRVFVVETEGDFLEAGAAVEVVEASGNRIIVRKC